jgi:lipoate-protein ligase B
MPTVVDWGRRDYQESLAEMRSLVRQRRAGKIDDLLILVEHPAVVTVGVEGDDGGAAGSGLPLVAVERGGKATYHGPGQQVGYPIVDLDPRGRDVRRFVRDVEGIVVHALAGFGITAGHVSGRPGVWVDERRKIASVGVAIDHWVSFHGFALNVASDLTAFERFHPCGFDGTVMTSVSRELRRSVDLAEVRPGLVAGWEERFARSSSNAAPAVSAPTRGSLPV